MKKSRILYVGHSYHKKTSSTAFFIHLLQSRFDVEVIWDESWQPDGVRTTARTINAHEPDYVIFFQLVISRRELRRIRCKRLIVVPMHDHVVPNQRLWTTLSESGMRAINFCKATHEMFTRLRFDSIYAQYWPSPMRLQTPARGGIRIFFWPRVGEIGWPLLKVLLGQFRPERIVMRTAPDPGQNPILPNLEEIAEYRIELIDGWMEKQRYIELLSACNLFMAPRRYEGIGQSFLEAMSMGLAVIAPDSPTMNEYIRHGRNGYLYSIEHPATVDFSNAAILREQAQHDVEAGYRQWQVQQNGLLDFIEKAHWRQPSLMWRLRKMLNQ